MNCGTDGLSDYIGKTLPLNAVKQPAIANSLMLRVLERGQVHAAGSGAIN